MTAFADFADFFMDATLDSIEVCVASTGPYQFVVGAIFDETSTVERQDAVGKANGGQTVGDNEHCAPLSDLRHVLLDDALALIVKRARGFVENHDAWIAHQRSSNRDALALTAGKAAPRSPTIVS